MLRTAPVPWKLDFYNTQYIINNSVEAGGFGNPINIMLKSKVRCIVRRITFLVITFFLSCIVWGSVSFSHAGQKTPVKLAITLDKEEYGKSDGIMMTLGLENTGKESLHVNKRFFLNSEESLPEYREAYLIVESPSGEKLPCKISMETGFPRTTHLVELGPGEKVEVDRPKNIKYFFDFTDPGEYKMTAVYQNIYGEEIGVNVFKEKIVSEPVTIKISG